MLVKYLFAAVISLICILLIRYALTVPFPYRSPGVVRYGMCLTVLTLFLGSMTVIFGVLP